MKKVIILHGWTKKLDKWDQFLKLLKKNKEYDIAFPKIPGLTEKLNIVWTLDDYTAWLRDSIDKDKNKVILIGHSNGGRIALSYTHKYPEKVEKLILVDSAGIYHNQLAVKLKRLMFKNIAKIGKKITSSSTLKNLLYKVARESDYKDLDENTKKTMVNLISTDLTPVLSKIKIPTLIVWGNEDKITPLSDAFTMNQLIKNSELEIIQGAKHSPMFTHPEKTASIVLEFIQSS
jgi:pimeloyl-ACP methyl ester carboxylesterase